VSPSRARSASKTGGASTVKHVLGSVLGAVLGLLLWGVGIEPRLIDWRAEEAALEHLPPAWQGQQIALIADLQVGMWLDNVDTIRRIVDGLVERRPAAVLIAGDFVYQPTDDEMEDVREEYEFGDAARELERVAELLRPLIAAGIPTYAVLGNHDYGMQKRESIKLEWLGDRVRERLTELGVRVLHNEADVMEAPATQGPSAARQDTGEALYVAGIGPLIAGEARPEAALAAVPAAASRIVLMHHPDVFARLPAGSAPLALAGHTHGGQVRIPFLPEWSWFALTTEDDVHVDGWIDGYGAPGNRLYVNRGIGFSLLPVRINCPPEVTLFTLVRP
jgi:hypothetical protein